MSAPETTVTPLSPGNQNDSCSWFAFSRRNTVMTQVTFLGPCPADSCWWCIFAQHEAKFDQAVSRQASECLPYTEMPLDQAIQTVLRYQGMYPQGQGGVKTKRIL